MTPSMMEITKKRPSANSWRDDLADAAFGKISAVYGRIDENGPFVRNRGSHLRVNLRNRRFARMLALVH
jgi:hypothetical protein